ncbi:MAG: diguanylate cyclase [Rhodocyclaceae bacterium]|nr:diguanylate cyclase [Rhodocyclaceae bacterium]MBX3670409.1 diguanylate cyclase [Rhodocyclaceae bacterium]
MADSAGSRPEVARRQVTQADRRRIGASEIFCTMTADELDPLLPQCSIIELEAEEILLPAGQHSDTVYLVLTGRLQIQPTNMEETDCLGMPGGGFVGEKGLVDGGFTFAQVAASSASTVLEIPRNVVWAMIDTSRTLSAQMLQLLARPVRPPAEDSAEAWARRQEREQARNQDSVTGLRNRRWLEHAFPAALEEAQKHHAPACLMMIDVDHFEPFRIKHGTGAGDRALQAVGRALASRMRGHDLLARYGDDEFALLAPLCDVSGGRAAAERLRAAVAAWRVTGPEGQELPGLTVSVGVAEADPHDWLLTLVVRASEALRRAKRGGRNRIEWESADGAGS